MRTQNVKKAISLIVLVLTVVLMIILTAVTITSISNGGIFNKANVATFKTMVASMKEEFVAYNSNKLLTQLNGYYNIGEYNSNFLGADETSLTYKGVAIENKNITDVLKSISETNYVSSFVISQGEIIYTGSDESLSTVASEILYNRSDVTTVRTTGETSVTVVNASDEYLKDYTIYGNSEQDGTPTPTDPITVGSLGERNLFNKTFEYTTSPTFENAILLEAGQYVFAINSHSNATKWRFYKKIYDMDGNDITSSHDTSFDIRYDNANTHNYYNTRNNIILWGANYSLISERINVLKKCYISFGYSAGDTTAATTFSKIQLVPSNTIAVKSSNGTETQTTIDLTGHDSLRKIGDVADYIDYKNSRIVRNIGKHTFTNVNEFTLKDSYTEVAYARISKSADDIGYGVTSNYDVISETHTQKIAFFNSADMVNCFRSAGVGIYFFGFPFGTSLEEMANSMIGRSYYYQLSTPIYEPIILPQIPVYQNGSITVNGASNISIVYTQTK